MAGLPMKPDIIRFWPLLVAFVGIIASATTAQIQIRAHAEDIDDHSESIDSNEEAIEEIQRLLIQRQGQQSLDIQRLSSEIDQQNIKLDQLLDILEDVRRGQ